MRNKNLLNRKTWQGRPVPRTRVTFENVFTGLDAGGLPVGIELPSATAVLSSWGLGSVGYTANEASLTSAATGTSPLDARSVALLQSQPRAAVPERENAARDFFPAP